jgi:hypothetical protein
MKIEVLLYLILRSAMTYLLKSIRQLLVPTLLTGQQTNALGSKCNYPDNYYGDQRCQY